MKKYSLLVIAFLIWQQGFGQFAVQAFTSDHSFIQGALATDLQNNVIIAGMSNGASNARKVAIKYSSGGAVLWVAESVNPGTLRADKVATDPAGNVFVAGHMTGGTSAQLVGGPAWVNNGTNAIFLAKYTPGGTLLWAQTFGNFAVKEIACTANGDVLLAGDAFFPVAFGGSVSIPGNRGFVVKFSGSGTALWAQQLQGGMGTAYTAAIAGMGLDQSGNIYLAGSFSNTLSIGSLSLTGGSGDIFVAKLTDTGSPLWLKASAGTASIGNLAISTNAQGNVFVSGTYRYGLSFDNVALPFINGRDKGFAAGYSSSGNVLWATNLGGTADAYVHPYAITSDNQGNAYISGSYDDGTAHFGSYSFTSPFITGNVFFCMVNPMGTIGWALSGDATGHNSAGFLLASGQNNVCYLSGRGFDTDGAFTLGGLSTTDMGNFLYKFNTEGYNRVTGTVYFDLNANGIKDAGEPAATGIVLQVNNLYFTTDANGHYVALADTGTSILSIPAVPLYYTAAPGSHTVSFSNYGNLDSARHFALQPLPNMQDLRITLSSPASPKPGFAYPLHITYKNIGTIAMSGSAVVALDPLLLFQSSLPVPGSQTGSNYSWSFTNLQPTQSATVIINTVVPTTAVLGTVLNISAQVLPLPGDLTPADNSSSLTPVVVGSWDPNDKQVSQNWLHPTEVAAGKYLNYTIRFQNTGTDTAFTVRIIDTLDTQLNIPTFELLQASHTSSWSIRGNGIIEFQFDNILLPDSNTNEAASHGFIRYRIKPRTTLVLGDVIRNTAGIYFDFNAPVITNTTTTEVRLVSGLAEANKQQLHVYPNPNKGEFTMQLSGVQEPSLKAELRNMLGQVVWQQNVLSENGSLICSVRTNDLSKGVYYLQVHTSKGAAVQKVVVE